MLIKFPSICVFALLVSFSYPHFRLFFGIWIAFSIDMPGGNPYGYGGPNYWSFQHFICGFKRYDCDANLSSKLYCVVFVQYVNEGHLDTWTIYWGNRPLLSGEPLYRERGAGPKQKYSGEGCEFGDLCRTAVDMGIWGCAVCLGVFAYCTCVSLFSLLLACVFLSISVYLHLVSFLLASLSAVLYVLRVAMLLIGSMSIHCACESHWFSHIVFRLIPVHGFMYFVFCLDMCLQLVCLNVSLCSPSEQEDHPWPCKLWFWAKVH